MTEPYTAADVQLVAEAMSGPRWKEVVPLARVAVSALAEAGRLVPDGAKIIEEIGVRVDEPHPARKEKSGTVMTHFPRENALRAPEVWPGWTVVRRKAIKWAGPWVEADEESTR